MLKKKKSSKLKKNALRRFSAIFGPEINSLTCDFFIYEAILAFFFVLFVLMIFYCIEYQKFISEQIRAIRCILFLGVVGGSRPHIRITCFHPKMIFFSNMTNILRCHLLKSVNKR